MAVAFDAVTNDGTSSGAPESSRTFSHTCTGSSRLLVVAVCNDEDTSATTVSTITYAGVALTQRTTATRVYLGSNLQRVSLWYLIAPASGANNVIVTLSASQEFVAAATSFTGVDQTTPLGTAATSNGNTSSPSVSVASATDEIVLDAVSVNGTATYTIGGGQTQRWARTAANTTPSTVVDSRGSTETGAASTTMSWTLTSSGHWVIAAVPIKPTVVLTSATTVTVSGGGSVATTHTFGPDYDYQVAINF